MNTFHVYTLGDNHHLLVRLEGKSRFVINGGYYLETTGNPLVGRVPGTGVEAHYMCKIQPTHLLEQYNEILDRVPRLLFDAKELNSHV
jgi:hypothetical protein